MCFLCSKLPNAAISGVLAATLGLSGVGVPLGVSLTTPAHPSGSVATAAAQSGLRVQRTSYDDAIREAEEQARDLRAEREAVRQQLGETTTRLEEATLELMEVSAQLPVAQARLDRAESDLEAAQREQQVLAGRLLDALDLEDAIAEEISASAIELDDARASVAAMARDSQRRQGDVSALSVITGFADTDELARAAAVSSSAARARTRALTQVQDSQAVALNQQQRLAAVRDVIADLHRQAEENVLVYEAASREAAAYRDEVGALVNQQAALTAEIQQEFDSLQQMDDELAQAEAAQDAQIAALVGQRDAEIERRRQEEEERRQQLLLQQQQQQQQQQPPVEECTTNEDGEEECELVEAPAPPPPVVNPSGNFLDWPVNNPHVTSPFGMRWHPVFGGMRMHNGTDFRAPCGTPIFASQSGQVVTSSYNWHQGHHIVIDHGRNDAGENISTLYSKMQSRAVSVGQWVNQGDVIAHSGMTGISTGCHLHFEVFVNGSRVDPMTRLPRR